MDSKDGAAGKAVRIGGQEKSWSRVCVGEERATGLARGTWLPCNGRRLLKLEQKGDGGSRDRAAVSMEGQKRSWQVTAAGLSQAGAPSPLHWQEAETRQCRKFAATGLSHLFLWFRRSFSAPQARPGEDAELTPSCADTTPHQGRLWRFGVGSDHPGGTAKQPRALSEAARGGPQRNT